MHPTQDLDTARCSNPGLAKTNLYCNNCLCYYPYQNQQTDLLAEVSFCCGYLLWFGCEMTFIGSHIWIFGLQLMVLFGKIVEPSRDGALLQEVGFWGVLKVLQPDSTSCLFCASWLQVGCNQPSSLWLWLLCLPCHDGLYPLRLKAIIKLTSLMLFVTAKRDRCPIHVVVSP